MKKVNAKVNVKEEALLNEKEIALNEALNVKEEDLNSLINEGNINEVLKKFSLKSKGNKGSKESTLYKDAIYMQLNAKERKSLRMKVRRQRNNFAKHIIKAFKEKQNEELNTLIKDFNLFYKTFYKVNDLSFHSLSAKNNDEDTYELINDMINVIKKHKVK